MNVIRELIQAIRELTAAINRMRDDGVKPQGGGGGGPSPVK